MKIEEGMFVRVKGNSNRPTFIAKITEIGEHNIWTDYSNSVSVSKENNEYATSFNIIDLIEVGDYVNGCKVHKIANCITIILDNEENISWVNPSDIKSIVTKEQFKANEYVVE